MKKFLVMTLAFCVLTIGAAPRAETAEQAALKKARESAQIAGESLGKVKRWVHEIALKKIDPETGLYIADGHWNYRDTAADCYPFFTWAAWMTDKDVLNNQARAVLHAEQELCNELDRIPTPYDWENKKKIEIKHADLVFEASEYVKDGLIAIVEVTGRDEWFDRMRAIEDDLWKYADIDTPFGKIPSTNVEVNGEQIQALARLYTMTGDRKYLRWAERLADYYLSDPEWAPKRLRDHGCEIIGGLGLLLGVESTVDPEKAKRYAKRFRIALDVVLERGTDADGMMYNMLLEPGEPKPVRVEGKRFSLSDGWGYNYVGNLCYDMATDTDLYRPKVAFALGNMMKPVYKDFPWEGSSIDGYADSIEGAIYLLNRVPSVEGLAWADRESVNNLVNNSKIMEHGELWGTMKLQANGVRTTLIHAFMHTQGTIARPWRVGLELGAAPCGEGLAVVICSDEDYEGLLEFDIPRHKLYMGFRKDWPRMNTMPEWFTVELEKKYVVRLVGGGEEVGTFTGQQLHNGLALKIKAGQETLLFVEPVK